MLSVIGIHPAGFNQIATWGSGIPSLERKLGEDQPKRLNVHQNMLGAVAEKLK